MSDEVIQIIKKAEDTGKELCRTFVDERMIKMTKPFHDLYQRTILQCSSRDKRKHCPNHCLKRDLQLFSRMYISCQAREGEIGSRGTRIFKRGRGGHKLMDVSCL